MGERSGVERRGRLSLERRRPRHHVVSGPSAFEASAYARSSWSPSWRCAWRVPSWRSSWSPSWRVPSWRSSWWPSWRCASRVPSWRSSWSPSWLGRLLGRLLGGALGGCPLGGLLGRLLGSSLRSALLGGLLGGALGGCPLGGLLGRLLGSPLRSALLGGLLGSPLRRCLLGGALGGCLLGRTLCSGLLGRLLSRPFGSSGTLCCLLGRGGLGSHLCLLTRQCPAPSPNALVAQSHRHCRDASTMHAIQRSCRERCVEQSVVNCANARALGARSVRSVGTFVCADRVRTGHGRRGVRRCVDLKAARGTAPSSCASTSSFDHVRLHLLQRSQGVARCRTTRRRALAQQEMMHLRSAQRGTRGRLHATRHRLRRAKEQSHPTCGRPMRVRATSREQRLR